jgi:hypothetical protein
MHRKFWLESLNLDVDENNIKTDLKEASFRVVDWFQMALVRYRLQTVVNTVMIIKRKAWNFLTR